MTVSQLAAAVGLSRSTVLYYESIGLLRSAKRTQSNYRVYGERDLHRLQQIHAYRAAGLTLDDIRSILNRPDSDFAVILKRRMTEIGGEIERLRQHQQAIARMLQVSTNIGRNDMITKDKWVEIMRAAGLNDADMHRWHAQFEKLAPAEHEEFLKFLHIPDAEVSSIRDWSRKQAT